MERSRKQPGTLDGRKRSCFTGSTVQNVQVSKLKDQLFVLDLKVFLFTGLTSSAPFGENWYYPNILPIRPKQQSEKLVSFGQQSTALKAQRITTLK